MQCCGDPFAVGDEVEWTLDAEPDLEWLESAVGMDLARRIVYAEEHHGGVPDDTPTTRSKVLAIKTAHSRYAPQTPGGKTLYPVAGSSVLRDVDRVDGSESNLPEMRFNGYVVEVELAEPSP
jgi:hypothetical protein